MSEEVNSDWAPEAGAVKIQNLLNANSEWECVSVDYVRGGYLFYVRTRIPRFYLSLDEEKVTHPFTCPAWCPDDLIKAPSEARDQILRYAKKELKYAVSCAISK